MNVKPIPHIYQSIDGWFDYADIFDEAIATALDGDCLLETGTWFGRSAAYMAVEIINSGKSLQFFSVDNEPDKEKAASVAKLLSKLRVDYINDDSLAVADQFNDGSLHLIFLDSCHEGEFVAKELRKWWPKLKPGGLFAGHDYHSGYPCIVQAVQEFAAEIGKQVIHRGSSWQIV